MCVDRAELFQGFKDGQEVLNELVVIGGFNAIHFVFWFLRSLLQSLHEKVNVETPGPSRSVVWLSG